jgi:hypothetical protein
VEEYDGLLEINTNLDENIFELSNLAAILLISNYNNTKTADEKSKAQEKLNQIKNKTDILLIKLAQVYNFTINQTILVGDTYINAQLYKSDASNKNNDIALKNDLSIVLSENCTKQLQKEYGIEDSLIILKTEYDSSMNLDNLDDPNISNSVNYKVFDPNTREELNTNICDSYPIRVKTKIKVPKLINFPYYKEMKDQNIDIYDINSPAFNEICVYHIDTETGFDTTVNWRRKFYYQNISVICADSNCTYAGLDDEGYVNCDCYYLTPDDELTSDFESYVLNEVSVWNFDVIYCYEDIIHVR